MPTSVIDHIRRTVLPLDHADDGELLGRFIERRDEAALAALVKRHGPMVWGVCRRLLNHHDAEDAFQAAFIVLVRKAASVVPREMVGNWLYGVAHQAALQARRTIARRRAREVQVTEMPDTAATQNDQGPDVQPLLDLELSRLPDHYRAVIILCDLEGKTRKEAARHLGLPEGTVASRLVRARAMLAKRLTLRGVALSGGALATVLAHQAASAGVPNSVVVSTIKAASLFAAGKAAATGAISVKVAALTEGVMKAMLFNQLKAFIAVVLMLGFVATGATILTCRTAAGQDDKKPAAEKPVEPAAKQEKEKETFTAWGKEVGGLQAGLGFRPGEKRAYSHGEAVAVVLRVRNVGKEAVEFKHIWAFFVENPPTITDADGKVIQLPGFAALGLQGPRSTNVAPGKEVELYEWSFDLRPQGESGNKGSLTIHGTGKFSLQCERIVGPTSANPNHPNPKLGKLATGKLELEVKEGHRAESGVEPQREARQDANSAYTTADIVVQYRDESGREVRDLKQFRVKDAETVAKLASHFPGILGNRGSGPRTTAGKRATFTIKFNHKSGEASQLRVAHVTPDYATWWWRDKTPYTGDRQVKGKDQLQTLMERLAAKNKVDLK